MRPKDPHKNIEIGSDHDPKQDKEHAQNLT